MRHGTMAGRLCCGEARKSADRQPARFGQQLHKRLPKTTSSLLLFLLTGLSSAAFSSMSASREGSIAASKAGRSSKDWRSYDPKTLPDWLTVNRGETTSSDSGVAELDAQNPPTDLSSNLAWRQRPFIMRGCPNLISMQRRFDRNALIEAADTLRPNVSIGYSWSITRNRGEGPERLPLNVFLRDRMYESWHDGDTRLEPAYAFTSLGASDVLADERLGFPKHSDAPMAFSSWAEPAFAKASRILMLGAAESAVGWHRHGASVQMTVHGWKRWFLYPEGSYPPGDGPGGGFSITDWLRVIYPTLPATRAPIECIQRPGDTMYVPGGWYHAVVNLADSMAVTLQSEFHAEPQDAFKAVSLPLVQQMQAANPQALLELEEAAERHISLHPGNDLHARKVMFYMLQRAAPAEAFRIMVEGISSDPFHVPMQFEVAKWLEERASSGDLSALQQFKEAMVLWQPFLQSNTRNLKALWILSKFFKLTGDIAEHQRHHARLIELHQRGIDR